MPIYKWEAAATWSLFAMIACIVFVFTPQNNAQSLGRSLGEITSYKTNLRTAPSAFWETGERHEAILNFCSCMNMYSMSEPSYRNLNDELHVAYFDAAPESMQKAGEEAFKKPFKI